MSKITYTVSQGSPGDISSFEIIDFKDGQLVDQMVIQSKFNPQTDKVEAHFYSLDGTLLQSFRDYTEYIIPRGKINKDQDLIEINLNPEEDTIRAGFTNGDVHIIYNFLRRAIATANSRETNLFIEAISPDRTEIRAILAADPTRDPELITAANSIKERIETSEFLEQFVLNFTGNRLLVGVNIDTTTAGPVAGILIKLYQPLPEDLGIKDIFTLEEIVSDSILFEVESQVTIEPPTLPSLRGPNFDIEDVEDSRNPTEFLTLSQLLPSGSSAQLQSILQEKGIELGIDYSNFENFIFFSSAKERVENFLYKATLISGSSDATEIQNVKNKFDHYERYLYFTDEFHDKTPEQQDDYFASASLYDELNFNKLTNSIPSFILEDSRNLPYVLFVDMVAQHFDNIWIYAKGLTDRYKADNRLNYGISKDLVKQAVENLGINLYRSNKSVESLFNVFQGETYISGSEVISGSIKQFSQTLQPISKNDYLKEIYKRVYHNVPLLLKSKGTERGVRSLINCFGIPDNLLDIKVYENTPLSFSSDLILDHTTSSLDRIRIQPTGSLVEGDLLSVDTRIQTYDTIYDENLSTVEIGFSPTNNVDLFISSSGPAENLLDDLLGDPSDYDKRSYNSLQIEALQTLGATKPYNVQEFVRLIKFYDNALFRVVQEFIPARTELVSGIVIKPHLLERSKRKGTTAKWVKFFENKGVQNAMDFSHTEYNKNFQLETELQIASIGAQDAGSIPSSYSTSYTSTSTIGTNNEQARFTGEFENSRITVASTDVSARNRFKTTSDTTLTTDRFQNSDYDILTSNIQNGRRSTIRTEVENLRNAELQDSNYTDTGWTNARYNGSTAVPRFTPSGSDLFRCDGGDYPILRLQSSEALIFEKAATLESINKIRNIPPAQLKIQRVFFSTFSRPNSVVGLRQTAKTDSTISRELFSGSSNHPRVQTFLYVEEDGRLRRVAEKQVLFLELDRVDLTDQNGKVLGTFTNPEGTIPPSEASGSTIVYLTEDVLSLNNTCGVSTRTTQFFILPQITDLSPANLLGKQISTSTNIENVLTGSLNYYGLSAFAGSLSTISIEKNANGYITQAVACSGGGDGSGVGEI